MFLSTVVFLAGIVVPAESYSHNRGFRTDKNPAEQRTVPGPGNEAVIYGVVRDQQTGAPLIGVNVMVDGTRLGAATGSDGHYRIEGVPVGTYRLIARMIGYKVRILRGVRVGPDGTIRVDIAMESQPVELETVTVTRPRLAEMENQVRTSLRNLRIQDIKSMAGGAEDLFRTIQTMPGVVARADYSTQFYVRGGTPDQNLIFVDDVTVFNPYRLKLFGGPISMFNPDVVERVTLYPGGFPAEYGDKLSAVLVVNNKEGDRFEHHYKTSGSLIDMKLFAEGPLPGIGEDGSWLFSSRRTYYDLILNRLGELPPGTILPYFRDYQMKVVYDLAPTQKLRLNLIDSNEGMRLKDLDVADGDSDDLFQDEDKFSLTYGIDNRLYSVSSINAISDVTLSTLTLSQYNDTWFFTLRAGDQSYRPTVDMRKLEIRDDVKHIFSSRHTAQAGMSIADYITDITVKLRVDSAAYYQDNPDDRLESDTTALVHRQFRLQNAATTVAFYLQDEWKVLPPRLRLLAGLRADHSTFTQEWVYSPRLSLTYLLTTNLVVRGGWGYFYQAPNFVSLFERFEREIEWNLFETITLKTEKSVHYLAGLEWQPRRAYTVKLESYYKVLADLVVPTDSTEKNIPNNQGHGFAYGYEVFFQKKPSPETRLSGWLSYSYGVTKEEDPKVKLHYRDFDQRHTLNIVARLKPSSHLVVDTKYSYGSGFPWTAVKTDVNDEPLFDERGNVIWEAVNSRRYPPYSRWDVRLTWRHRFADKLQFMIYLEVINLLNHKNVYEYYWSGDYRTRFVSYMLPRMPFFGLELRL
jgi:outer membrane receptor for ferrienterochelin and colicin